MVAPRIVKAGLRPLGIRLDQRGVISARRFRGSRTPSPVGTAGAVKAMTRSLAVDALASYLDTLLPLSAHSLRQKLQAYARDHGVAIEAG